MAYLAVRWLAPLADPLILPCAALLNGLGLVMIHRLDLAAAADALRHMVWTAVALVLFVAVLWRVHDHHRGVLWLHLRPGGVGVIGSCPGYCRRVSARSTAPSCGCGWVRCRSGRVSSPRS